MQTPDPLPPPASAPPERPRPLTGDYDTPFRGRYWSLGELLTLLSGLVLTLSAFMDWYAGSETGGAFTLSVIGWHTGALGKLVFFVGLVLLGLVILREFGFELPPSVPESLVVIALGSLATIFVLIRLISVPNEFFGTAGRGIGIFISLVAAVLLIGAGLLRAAEEL